MRDIVIQSHRHVGYHQTTRRVIRDVIAPIGSVARLHQRLFSKPQEKQIPVKEAAEVDRQKLPLSAFMIDPKYLTDEVQIEPKADTLQLEPKPHPPVLQYSRITRNPPETTTPAWQRRLQAFAYPLGAFVVALTERVSSSEVLARARTALESFAETSKDKLAIAMENTAHWYKEHFIYPAPIHYSLYKNEKKPRTRSERDGVTVATPIIAAVLLPLVAFYGLLTNDGGPINPPEDEPSNGPGMTLPTATSSEPNEKGASSLDEDSNDGSESANQSSSDSSPAPGSTGGSTPSSSTQQSATSPTDPAFGGRGGGEAWIPDETHQPTTGTSGGSGNEGTGTQEPAGDPSNPPATDDPSIETPLDPVLDPVTEPLVEQTDDLLETQLLDTELRVPETEVKVQDTQILSTPETEIKL